MYVLLWIAALPFFFMRGGGGGGGAGDARGAGKKLSFRLSARSGLIVMPLL